MEVQQSSLRLRHFLLLECGPSALLVGCPRLLPVEKAEQGHGELLKLLLRLLGKSATVAGCSV